MNIIRFKIKSCLGLMVAPLLFILSLSQTGILTYSFLIAIPVVAIMDMLLPKWLDNPTKDQEKIMVDDTYYDILTWLTAPASVVCLLFYLHHIYTYSGTESLATLFGWATAMGGVGAVWGIAIGHELGHRSSTFEKYLGKILLFVPLRMTFMIFHNYGHHKHVGTPLDPTSARKNDWAYLHIPRSLFLSWLHAWKIQITLLEAEKINFFSVKNNVFWYTIIQWTAIIAVAFIANWQTALGFVCAGLVGSLLFELINYVEHYGLRREKLPGGKYERVLPIHSWNDAHTVTGGILLNGMRHSDHHYRASRPYQILRLDESIPTNLPANSTAMMLLALIPPLYFYIMNRKIAEIDHLRAAYKAQPKKLQGVTTD
ncbi:alkane 1-monooxygenase [bacterium]|nr:alkane 1-monooxygenase [bacterium]